MADPTVLVVQHDLDDHLNEIAIPLIDAGLALRPWHTYTDPDLELEPADYAGVVSLGATAGVGDEPDLPWMATERKLLEGVLDAGMPVLGICFGAQLLASVAGGSVWRADRPEIGWTQVTMTDEAARDPLVACLGPAPDVVQFHYDTFDLPDDVTVLGRTGELVEAYRVGDRAWGLQFHIEVGPAAIYSWLATYSEEMRSSGVDLDGFREDTARSWSGYRERTMQVGAAFAAQVHAFAGS
jgi:GMP synthase (glutamine-hydrolysing)